jgi:hypothetical protein
MTSGQSIPDRKFRRAVKERHDENEPFDGVLSRTVADAVGCGHGTATRRLSQLVDRGHLERATAMTDHGPQEGYKPAQDNADEHETRCWIA